VPSFTLPAANKKLSKIILPFGIFRNPNTGHIKLTLHILTVAVTFNPTFNSIAYRVAVAEIVSKIFSYTFIRNSNCFRGSTLSGGNFLDARY